MSIIAKTTPDIAHRDIKPSKKKAPGQPLDRDLANDIFSYVTVRRVPGHMRTDCWLYKDSPDDYGIHKGRRAHRLMWQAYKGKIPDGDFICHRCDNPGCVNPHHLYAGNAQTNTDDKIRNTRPRSWGRTIGM